MVLFYADDTVVNVEGPARFKGNIQVVINDEMLSGGELIYLLFYLQVACRC